MDKWQAGVDPRVTDWETAESEISRVERREEPKLSTIRKYVESLGGTLVLVVTMPTGQAFREEAKQRGLEPDECYCIGPLHEVPQIAIEVVITSGLVDKLDVYAGLGIAEVWVWHRDRLVVHALVDDR